MNVGAQKSIAVCAVQLWSTIRHTPVDNRLHALEMLERAAETGADLVVMPEAVSMLCYPDERPAFTYRDVAEPVPGPTTEAVAGIARRAGVNVVVGLIENRGADRPCQNVALVFDRTGALVGRYEKTHEPEVCRREQAAGVGNELPVFRLDFGTVGVFICWDLLAPEVASILTLKGAQLLCFPHLIALPTPRNFAVLLRARAIDNAVPIVAAGMRDPHNHNGSQDGVFSTCIMDATGNLLAQAEEAGPSLVMATIPLAPVSPDEAQGEEAWSLRRRDEVRPALYARSYARLSPSRADEGGI